MLPFNNQPGVHFGTSNDSHQWTAVHSNWDDVSEFLICTKRLDNLTPQQATVQATNLNVQTINNWSNQIVPQYQYRCNGNANSSQEVFSQMQTQQAPPAHFCQNINQYFQPQNCNTVGRPHLARINLVPNSNGGFKAIVKRKRKRTMFTTEQVEAMESVFQRKPYVTRDDRQLLVQQLHLSDTCIKVWFQNRRLRGKRAAEEAAEQALYEDINSREPSFYSSDLPSHNNSTHSHFSSGKMSQPEVEDRVAEEASEQALHEVKNSSAQSFLSSDSSRNSTESYSSSLNMSNLDDIEYELMQKADESGNITLDENSIERIVTAIGNVLSPDIKLESDGTSLSEEANLTSGHQHSCNFIEDAEDSEGSTYSGSIYEPISPAASPKSDAANEGDSRWHPLAPDQSLQTLLDMHCF